MEALNAVSSTFPTIRARLGEIPASERPSYEAVVAVSLHLANRHRPGRGWANESVDQIAAELGMSERKVRRVLKALDVLGVWVAESKGNQHAPTKRTPTFMAEGSSGNRTEQNDGASSAKRTEQESEHRPVSTEHRPVAAGASSVHDGASSAKRTTPPSNPQSSTPIPQGVGGDSNSTALAVIPTTVPVLIQSAPDLAQLVRAVFEEVHPEIVYEERHAVAQAAAERWLTKLAKAKLPIGEVEGIVRWAMRHQWWSQKVSSVRDVDENWSAIVRQWKADQQPAVSGAQRRNLERIAARARKATA